MTTSVIYPGTFDPITLGHEDLIRRAAKIFDRIVVAIGINESKQPLLSVEKRIAMIKHVFEDLPHVEVKTFDGLLVDFAKTEKCNLILRGLRVVSDFDYEFQMATMNRILAPGLETIFLMPAERYASISSTLVRTIIRGGGDVSAFVPKVVLDFCV